MISKATFSYLLFSLAAIAISAASIIIVKDYGQILIWAAVLAASAASMAVVLFLGLKKKFSEFETIKYLISSQWLTLLLFCLMAILVDQSVYDMQHRIDYNKCSMALMLLAVVMTGTNSVSLIMYMKTTKDHLNESEVLMEKFDDNIKDLVNSICAANHQPPRYDTSKGGIFSFMRRPSPNGTGPSAKPRGILPGFGGGSAAGGASPSEPPAAGGAAGNSKPKPLSIRLRRRNGDTGGDGE